MPPFDGTLQKYFIAASDFCFPLPAHVSSEAGALVEPLAVAVEAVKTADFKGNQTVLVLGCGPIGTLCQAVSRIYAARRVVGVDISTPRAEFAKGFSADEVFVSERGPREIDASKANAQKILEQCGLGSGAHVVLECTGAEACLQAGLFCTKSAGMFVRVGLGSDISCMC